MSSCPYARWIALRVLLLFACTGGGAGTSDSGESSGTTTLPASTGTGPGVGHDSWTMTYDPSAGHDIDAWLLERYKQ